MRLSRTNRSPLDVGDQLGDNRLMRNSAPSACLIVLLRRKENRKSGQDGWDREIPLMRNVRSRQLLEFFGAIVRTQDQPEIEFGRNGWDRETRLMRNVRSRRLLQFFGAMARTQDRPGIEFERDG